MKRAWLTLALALALPSVANAQSSVASSLPANVRSDLARTHFRTGMRYFDLSRFDEAATEFERVYELTEQHELLYNIARAHEAAGHAERAVEVYELFLQRVPDAPNATAIRAHATELRERIPRRSASDPSPSPSNASAGALRCADGSTPSADTAPVASTTNASAAPLRTALPALPLVQLRTRVSFERSALNEVGPWVLGAAGVVMTGFGVWQALEAQRHIALIDAANRGSQAGWTIAVEDAYQRAPTSVALAWGLTSAGATAVVGSALWLIARGPGVRRELVVAASSDGASATVFARGAF